MAGSVARTAPSVADLLAAAVRAVPGGVARVGQQAMAAAVAAAYTDDEHLLVQAGTGTGKSLAYLVPALRVDGPVVVSTATLALQHQLIDHDLPRLAESVEPLLGRRPRFAVLKGRHHYLCLAKLHGAAGGEQDGLFEVGEAGPRTGRLSEVGEAGPRTGGLSEVGEAGGRSDIGRLGRQMLRLREWAAETETGDRDELDPGVEESAWRLVSMPARECVGALRCPFGGECFAEASRARARDADIVVTNHSLLAFDMLAGRHIIPPHELLIVDEAHELADRVSSASQAELSPDQVERAARRTRSHVEDDAVELLTEAKDALAAGLAQAAPGRLTAGLPRALAEALTLLDSATRHALNGIGEIKPDDPEAVRKQPVRAVLSEMNATAQRILSGSAFDVTWVERDDRRRAVVVAPLSVASTLRTNLYEDRTVVATSATLALGGHFDTIARAIGLPPTLASPSSADQGLKPVVRSSRRDHKSLIDKVWEEGQDEWTEDEDEVRWRALDVGSPFEYGRQGILYVAAHLPRPTMSGLPDPAAQELVRLVRALGGRTLGLFSSRRAAERAAEVVREQTDLEILLQGEEALPLLVKRFRREHASCLFGVMSLWQGVDVPGEACQLVVIDRLPFPRPDEPLAAARAAAVDAAGGSGFAAVSVPIAAVRLAQGVGRLIRSATDRGVVAVLDSRLQTARGYGSFLRRSLPPFWYTTKPNVVEGALRRLALESSRRQAADSA